LPISTTARISKPNTWRKRFTTGVWIGRLGEDEGRRVKGEVCRERGRGVKWRGGEEKLTGRWIDEIDEIERSA
jgi:hypothetical protein